MNRKRELRSRTQRQKVALSEPGANATRRDRKVRFQRRNCFVDALQWFKPGDHAAVEAQHGQWCVATQEGWRTVVPGDWIVTSDDGNPFPMSNHLFLRIYERVTETETDKSDPPDSAEP